MMRAIETVLMAAALYEMERNFGPPMNDQHLAGRLARSAKRVEIVMALIDSGKINDELARAVVTNRLAAEEDKGNLCGTLILRHHHAAGRPPAAPRSRDR